MKAVRIHQLWTGGLDLRRHPGPTLRKDQILVAFGPAAKPSRCMGAERIARSQTAAHSRSDVAGEVVESGEYVTGFKAGQRVLLSPMHYCGHCAKMRGRRAEPVPRIYRGRQCRRRR